MKVTNIADSCVLFEHEVIRLLTDPWIGTPTYGFWMQYPPPVHTPESVGRLDYIFISHLHEDHCDFPTLARLDPSARILILDRKPNLLREHLVSRGIPEDRIQVLPARTRVELAPGFSVEALEANPAHEYSRLVDSALLVHDAERTVYFANDAEPYEDCDRYIASHYQVELAMLPFYGGSGYPACYTNLSREEKMVEVKRIQRAYLGSVARCLSVVRPHRVTPIAAWHCFAGPVAELNSVMSWPESCDQMLEFMASLGEEAPEFEIFGPGQGIDLTSGQRLGGSFRQYTAKDRQDFGASQLRDAKPSFMAIPDSPAVRLDRLLEHASANFAQKAHYEFPEEFRYLFDCNEGIRYSFDPMSLKVSTEEAASMPSPPYLKITLDRRHLVLLLIGALSWNIEDVTGWLRYERIPNVYRPEVHVALNFLKI